MTAPDLAYVALVVDKPAASAAIFEKGSGLLRQDFACGGSKIRVLSVGRCALDLFRPADHLPWAGRQEWRPSCRHRGRRSGR